ncbi:FERM domain-containing protein [Caenorhabditis elegans]|uniref:FERM domain-containing protein n=1 Tax=Caenorhabditis elegans TaxID=6239 RepID=G5EF18_CAEEL|nr:FERM domain-containing protein [Caenorhabditis elegans]CAI46592.1 FERM domain-containing protein [Caenorhabditis elegans]|eukprot:NP_001021864.1 human KRIT 1 (Krev interaction trapped/cerebral cavernous malformation 1) homolog [Caenorhabditis elegans]
MAEVSVAIVRLKISALSDKAIPSAQDFEICVKEEPSTAKNFGPVKHDYNIKKRVTVGGHTIGADVFKLPNFSFEPSKVSTLEDMIHDYFKRTGNIIRRSVRIPLHDDLHQPSSSTKPFVGHVPGLSLVCVPVFNKESVEVANSRYENLQKMVNLCHNQPEMFDIHTKNMILILERWLIDSQTFDSYFLSHFFMKESSRTRIKTCVHNPAFIDLQEQCIRHMSHSVRSNVSSASADLDDRVHVANIAKIAMLRYNKFTISVINPAFNPNFASEDSSCVYFYPGIKQCRAQRAASSTSQDMRSRLYPLHKAAEDGNAEEIRRFLKIGMDSNLRDDDSWTPLHYACFHGHLEVVHELLNSPQMTAINAQNKGGATALQYAVINGNEYLVEILTSHASIDVNIQNNEGYRPIDYCGNHPAIQKILELQIFKSKINVDTSIGSFSIKSRSPEEATVGEVLDRLAEETQLNREQMNCFALFVYSESMSLQLQPDSLIDGKLKVDKWNTTIRKLVGDIPFETPRLKLKRNAYATARMEIVTKVDNNSFAWSTILDEAIHSYLAGHLIANSKEEITKFAAIVCRTMHGRDFKPSSKNLSNLYPQYMLDNHDRGKLADRLKAQLRKNETQNDMQLEAEFISMARGLVTYGASFFDVDVFTKKVRK